MAYRNASGWDDSGNDLYVKLRPGDTYRHGNVVYAHDGFPINSRDDYAAPNSQVNPNNRDRRRPVEETRPTTTGGQPRQTQSRAPRALPNTREERRTVGETRPSTTGGRPRQTESRPLRILFEERYGPPPPQQRQYGGQPHKAEARNLIELFEDRFGPPPDRPRESEEQMRVDEIKDFYSYRAAQGSYSHSDRYGPGGQAYSSAFEDACKRLESRYRNGKHGDLGPRRYPEVANTRPTVPAQPARGFSAAVSQKDYAADDDYHKRVHDQGEIDNLWSLYPYDKLLQYREYDERHFAGLHRSPLHGMEGRYGDDLRHMKYIARASDGARRNPDRGAFDTPQTYPVAPTRPTSPSAPPVPLRQDPQGLYSPRTSYHYSPPSPVNRASQRSPPSLVIRASPRSPPSRLNRNYQRGYPSYNARFSRGDPKYDIVDPPTHANQPAQHEYSPYDDPSPYSDPAHDTLSAQIRNDPAHTGRASTYDAPSPYSDPEYNTLSAQIRNDPAHTGRAPPYDAPFPYNDSEYNTWRTRMRRNDPAHAGRRPSGYQWKYGPHVGQRWSLKAWWKQSMM